MDPFTQNMINRTKKRQEMLRSKPAESGGAKAVFASSESPKVFKENSEGTKHTPTKAFKSVRSNDPGKENSSSANRKFSTQLSPSKSKDVESITPIQKNITQPTTEVSSGQSLMKNRFEALAGRVNDWEDEAAQSPKQVIHTPDKTKKVTPAKYGGKGIAQHLPSPSSSGGFVSKSYQRETKKATPTKATPTKAVVLEKSILHSLESQGFTPSQSRSRLIYEFEKEQQKDVEETEKTPQEKGRKSVSSALPPKSPAKPARAFSPVKIGIMKPKIEISSASEKQVVRPSGPSLSVLKRAAMFESPQPSAKDPAELPMSERKALFEKNKIKCQPTPSRLATPSATRIAPESCKTPATASGRNFNSSKSIIDQGLSAHKNACSAKADRMKELDALRHRHAKKDVPAPVQAEEEPEVDLVSETQADEHVVDMKPPVPPPMDAIAAFISPRKVKTSPRESPVKAYAGLRDVRNIRVSPPKPGKLYPCLSDIEMTTEYETDEEDEPEEEQQEANRSQSESLDLDSSFTVDILGRAGLSQFINTPKRKLQEMQASKESLYLTPMRSIAEHVHQSGEDSDDPANISDILNEALEQQPTNRYETTPPKQSRKESSERVLLPTLEDDGCAVPLYHSVSSYRKQQQDAATPSKQVVRNPEVRKVPINDGSRCEDSHEIPFQHQIRNLQEEINVQQNVIGQASQALNLCRATAEFSGSTEQVEGERLLLVASQKRQAAMNEIQRLKTEAAMKKGPSSAVSRGTLSISNLGLPLKKEFLSMLSKGGDDFIHYFIMLIRNKGQVIPLQMLSTLDGAQGGALRFPNLIQLRDLPANFEVVVEVYALQTRKEKLDHELKYHIRKESSSRLRLTPKKLMNKHDSRLLSKTNGLGSSSVRNSSFGLVGFTSITPATLRRQQWSLENVPLVSPIEGSLELKIQCHTESLIEERGFLTVFEDVAGFGAWHRRWCLLSNDRLLFWKYPDDEKRKEPLNHISLRRCVTETVGPVSHDTCARPNTFLLVTVRQPTSGDKDSLVMTCYPHRTAVRHLISADLKEERSLWCSQINRAVANLRAWDIDAQEPTSEGSALNKHF